MFVATRVFNMHVLHAIAFNYVELYSSQRNFLENATACSKRMLKTRVATRLYLHGNV